MYKRHRITIKRDYKLRYADHSCYRNQFRQLLSHLLSCFLVFGSPLIILSLLFLHASHTVSLSIVSALHLLCVCIEFTFHESRLLCNIILTHFLSCVQYWLVCIVFTMYQDCFVTWYWHIYSQVYWTDLSV